MQVPDSAAPLSHLILKMNTSKMVRQSRLYKVLVVFLRLEDLRSLKR